MTKKRAGLLLSVSMAAWSAIPLATAQDAGDAAATEGAEEVTVTAQKTKQSLQKVPLADTMAMTGHKSVASVVGYYRPSADNPAAKLL